MSENAYMTRRSSRRIGSAGRAAEKAAAKRIGGRQVPGSGAVPGQKGDIVVHDVLMEHKSTNRLSISVKYGTLLKVEQEAMERRRMPALGVSFTDKIGTLRKGGAWVLLRERDFKRLMEDHHGEEKA